MKREWGEERKEKKRIKKSFTWWTVTVYIYMVTIHLQDHCTYLDIFTKTDVGGFCVKMCKIEYFLYFRRLSMSWCGCSKHFPSSLTKNSIFLQIEEKIGIFTPFARERQNCPNPNCPSLQPHSFCSVLFWDLVEVGPCGLNCHKPKPNSTRNIIPSAADFDIYI